MKFLILFVSLVSGFDPNVNISTYDEFIAIVEGLGERLYGFAKFQEVSCQYGLKGKCFQLNSTTDQFTNIMNDEDSDDAAYAPGVPISSLLHYFSSNGKDFKALQNKEPTDISVMTSGNPDCKVVHTEPRKLAQAIEGKSSVTIKNEDVDSYSKSVKAGASVELLPAGPGSEPVELEKNVELSSIDRYTKSTVGGTFHASGEVCTPAVVQLSIVCKKLPRVAILSGLGDNGDQEETINKSNEPASRKHSIIPSSNNLDSYYVPIVGCIDAVNE